MINQFAQAKTGIALQFIGGIVHVPIFLTPFFLQEVTQSDLTIGEEPSFSNGTFAPQSVLRPAGKSFAPRSYDSFLREQARNTDSIATCRSL